MSDITFSKGSFSVGVDADNVSEEYSNKLIVLSLSQTKNSQESGARTTKILDLLRITHQFVIRAYITSSSTQTAKQVKDDLFSVANGGGINGGVISMVYDGDTYTGYLERIVCVKEARDHPDTHSETEVQYNLTLTFVVGEAI
jgi:hypothetical protein